MVFSSSSPCGRPCAACGARSYAHSCERSYHPSWIPDDATFHPKTEHQPKET